MGSDELTVSRSYSGKCNWTFIQIPLTNKLNIVASEATNECSHQQQCPLFCYIPIKKDWISAGYGFWWWTTQAYFLWHYVSTFLFKENDLQFTKNEIKLNVKDEIIKPTWAVVNELNSHGGRMITCQDLGKMCKWDQWTTIQNLWRSWGIWMMPKACWDINAIGNLKGVNKQSLWSTDYLYICFIGFEGVYIQKLRK